MVDVSQIQLMNIQPIQIQLLQFPLSIAKDFNPWLLGCALIPTAIPQVAGGVPRRARPESPG